MTTLQLDEKTRDQLREMINPKGIDLCGWCDSMVTDGFNFCDRCYDMIMAHRRKRKLARKQMKGVAVGR